MLVTGGAGAVGYYAVQLARAAGAEVVIDYRREDVAARVLDDTTGRGVERIVEVDLGANLAVTDRVLAPNGVVAAYASMAVPTPTLPLYSLLFRNATLHLIALQTVPLPVKTAAAAEIRDWCGTGRLSHPPQRALPLDAVVEAHELVESGTVIGKVVLAI